MGEDAGRRDDRPHGAAAGCIDALVATNLHADILSDLAAALAGPSASLPPPNLNPERRYPSMFEPIHGSAFDIIGKGIANPIGAFWTAVQMLEHLGEPTAASRLMTAIEAVTQAGIVTPDLGGYGHHRASQSCGLSGDCWPQSSLSRRDMIAGLGHA